MKYIKIKIFHLRPNCKCFLLSPKLCQCKLTSILCVTSPAFLSPRGWWWPGRAHSLRIFLCWSLKSLNSSIKLVKCGMISLRNVHHNQYKWLIFWKIFQSVLCLIILCRFADKNSKMSRVVSVSDCKSGGRTSFHSIERHFRHI